MQHVPAAVHQASDFSLKEGNTITIAEEPAAQLRS